MHCTSVTDMTYMAEMQASPMICAEKGVGQVVKGLISLFPTFPRVLLQPARATALASPSKESYDGT